MATVTTPAALGMLSGPEAAALAVGPLHAQSPVLAPILVVAAVGSVLVLVLAGAAFARRRSWSYALVALAVATLLARTVVGVLTVRDVVPLETHHAVEHGLDVVMVLLVTGAVWLARSARGDHA